VIIGTSATRHTNDLVTISAIDSSSSICDGPQQPQSTPWSIREASGGSSDESGGDDQAASEKMYLSGFRPWILRLVAISDVLLSIHPQHSGWSASGPTEKSSRLPPVSAV
jgi:hypothetical protein